MNKVAWIGTGVMGAPMAGHLADGGYHVKAYNRTFEKAQRLEPKIKACETIEAAVSDADIIFMIVGYPKDVEAVFNEVIQHAPKNAIIVDMTTSSPTLAKALYKKGKETGYRVIDAPVTGGDLGAINGTLSIMVGGDVETYNEIIPFLELLGKTITYMGNEGAGQHAKLANQICIAGALASLSEALVYAQENNLDQEAMLSVITGGSASSWQAVNNGPKMISKDYAPGFFAKHLLKDLTLALEEKGNADLPALTLVQHQFETLVNTLKRGDDGTQAIIEVYNAK